MCMEGPLFSTRAESHLYRSWGAQVIGMTNLQEAKLAREAGLARLSVNGETLVTLATPVVRMGLARVVRSSWLGAERRSS